MTKHPNNMTEWPEIRCQRGCEEHQSFRTHVSLGGPTPYTDLTSIPMDLRTEFELLAWNTALTPVDGGPYCPARDAVSQTILWTGVWEPRETVMALRVFKDNPGKLFLDFGAQIGWFSLLAALHDLPVYSWEADRDVADLLEQSSALNDLSHRILARQERIGPDSAPWPDKTQAWHQEDIALVKIDLEGAENEAIRMLDPAFGEGLVERLMIEVSPVFDDYYPDLVVDLMFGYGFRAFMLPPKHQPPVQLTGDPHELVPWELRGSRGRIQNIVASWAQEDVWFVREDLM